MAYPNPPDRQTSYTAIAQAQGDGRFPGESLDVDFDDLIRAFADTLQFIRGVIRSDGKLQNALVKRENLGADIALGFDAPTQWTADTDYVAGNTAFYAGGFYQATDTHTSSVSFNDDLASGRWVLLVDLAPAGALVAALNLSDLADAAEARANLGLGSLATSELVPVAKGGTGATTPAGARIALGLGSAATANVGIGVQAYSAELAAVAALTGTTFGRGFLTLVDAAAGRTKLGLGGLATQSILDEDDFATNSATRPPSQQSAKAYADNGRFGAGQEWTGQTGNRVVNTAYQNDTGRTIEIAITLTNTASAVQVSTNGTDWLTIGTGAGNNAEVANITVPIPPGHYYRVNGPFTRWLELR